MSNKKIADLRKPKEKKISFILQNMSYYQSDRSPK